MTQFIYSDVQPDGSQTTVFRHSIVVCLSLGQCDIIRASKGNNGISDEALGNCTQTGVHDEIYVPVSFVTN